MAGATHLALVVVFTALGAWMLAAVNVASVALFALAHQMLSRRRNLVASLLVLIEIYGHAVVACWTIGWDSGFHYYLLAIVPIAALSLLDKRVKLAFIASVGLLYLGMDLGFSDASPVYELPSLALDALRLLNEGVTIAILAYLGQRYFGFVRHAEEQLSRMADTDPLTRLFNRRRITEVLTYEASRAKRIPCPLALLLGDVDHFKSINDRHGHECGDLVLAAISDVLRKTLREQDSVARWGGEEFLVVLPDTTLDEAMRVAERLRQGLARANIVSARGDRVDVTMTFGAASLQPQEDPQVTIGRADAALYRGKQNGRDRVEAADAASGLPTPAA